MELRQRFPWVELRHFCGTGATFIGFYRQCHFKQLRAAAYLISCDVSSCWTGTTFLELAFCRFYKYYSDQLIDFIFVFSNKYIVEKFKNSFLTYLK